MTQQSIGGPPGVPVTLHGSSGPRVRLRYDHGCTGRVVREGPEQSIVRWRNGNEDCVCNAWIERIETLTNLSEATASSVPSPQGVQSLQVGQADKGSIPTELHTETMPKSKRREPDALARRVSEFDDAELKAFALANGCWDDKYMALPNNGLRRMNVMNRLRAKLKREPPTRSAAGARSAGPTRGRASGTRSSASGTGSSASTPDSTVALTARAPRQATACR